LEPMFFKDLRALRLVPVDVSSFLVQNEGL
jgi:hypothetical protein